MVELKNHKYLITVWHGIGAAETGVMLQTSNKAEWIRECKRIIHDNRLDNSNCETIERKGITIFSFAKNHNAGSCSNEMLWRERDMFISPLSRKRGFTYG